MKEHNSIKYFLYFFCLLGFIFSLLIIRELLRYNYISTNEVGVIITSLTLLFEIINSAYERRKSIFVQKNIKDQENFENIVSEVLDFYSNITSDFVSYALLDIKYDNTTNAYRFDINSLDRLNSMVSNYYCKLRTYNNKIEYLYGMKNKFHPEYDKFKIKVIDLNTSIDSIMNDLSILINKCVDSPAEGFSERDVKNLNDRRNECVNKLQNLFECNINEMYILATNCVDERNKLRMK